MVNVACDVSLEGKFCNAKSLIILELRGDNFQYERKNVLPHESYRGKWCHKN
jgi:hypothetical protein